MSDEIISINDYVTVTLTQTGADAINHFYASIVSRFPRAKDLLGGIPTYQAGDVFEDQLWSLMSKFEGYVGLGGEVVFKDFQIGHHKAEREKKK